MLLVLQLQWIYVFETFALINCIFCILILWTPGRLATIAVEANGDPNNTIKQQASGSGVWYK